MIQFDKFVARHGESAAQAIIENIERFEGVKAQYILSLEERWQRLMHVSETQGLAA